ncbi:MAG: DUF6798 domain-containing protein [Calditrichia bacterium]
MFAFTTYLQWLRSNWQLWLIIFLAALQGYHFGVGDLSTYVPFVWHHFDNTLFANDLLVETLADHPVYIWQTFALLLNLVDIQLLFLFLFFAQITLLTFAYRFFYQTFFPGNSGWILLLLTLVVPALSAAMGRYGLNPYEYFHPGALAFGVLLIGYSLIDRGYWLSGSAVLGFIFLFHPFTALYGAMILAFRMLIDLRRVPFKTLFFSGVLFLTISAPAWASHLIHMFSEQTAPFDRELWLELVQFRMSISFFIFQWVPDRIIHLVLAVGGILAFHKHPSFKRLLPMVFAVLTALVLMAIAELFSIKFFLQLQLARNSFLLLVIVAAFIIDRLWDMPAEKLRGPAALLILVPLVLLLQGAVGDRSNPIRWALVALAIAGLIYILWKGQSGWQKNYLNLAWILVLVITTHVVIERHSATGRWFDVTGASPWEEVQLWCQENVPVSETIMTPIYRPGFRSHSLRSIYGSYKDGAPHNYSKKTIFRWWVRMQKMGVGLPFNRWSLPELYRNNAVSAARNENIRYFVFERHPDVAWDSVLYENERFGVVDLWTLQNNSRK